MRNILQDNSRAIYELENGDEAVARDLLRINAIKAPCCATLNNLGVYYSQYGMLLKNGKVRSAAKLGLRHLLKASTYDADWRNYVSIATAVSEHNDIQTAYEMFLKAYELEKDSIILYNIGACLYKLQRYEEALPVFEALYNDDDIDMIIGNQGDNPLIVLAYCHYKLNNKSKCAEYIKSYQRAWDTFDILDIFCLRYLCGMYDEALAVSEELLREWQMTDTVLAMFADCVEKSSDYKRDIVIPSEDLAQWNLLKSNLNLREQKIKEDNFTPTLIGMYWFIDN